MEGKDMITKDEIQELLHSTETYRVERTTSTTDMDKFQEAICAFSNDLPNSRKKGYLILGAYDNGTLSGLMVTDALLKKIAAIRSDGNILPIPVMSVERLEFPEGDLLVAEVTPSMLPPVRYRGRTFVRIGPRRDIATEAEERILAERRTSYMATFDATVRPTISLNLVTDQEKVTKSETKASDTVNDILTFCTTPRSMTEIMEHIGLKHRYNVKHRYIDPLIDGGFIKMTIPDKPNSRSQKYKRTLT